MQTPRQQLALSAPDGNDVGEQEKEADDLQVPTPGEVLEGDHDQRYHHQGSEEDLREAVHLQVEQADLWDGTWAEARDEPLWHSPPRVWRDGAGAATAHPGAGPPREPAPWVRQRALRSPTSLGENTGLHELTDIPGTSRNLILIFS